MVENAYEIIIVITLIAFWNRVKLVRDRFYKRARSQYFEQIPGGNNSYDYTQKCIIITHKRTKIMLYENSHCQHSTKHITLKTRTNHIRMWKYSIDLWQNNNKTRNLHASFVVAECGFHIGNVRFDYDTKKMRIYSSWGNWNWLCVILFACVCVCVLTMAHWFDLNADYIWSTVAQAQ